MITKIIAFILHSFIEVTILFFFFIHNIYAQNNIILEGNSYQFDKNTNTSLYSEPRVFFEDWEITGKTLTYNTKEKTLFLEGDIYVHSSDLILTGKELFLDIKKKELYLRDSTLYHKKDHIYIIADRIEKTGKQQFTITNATLTQCNPNKPAWELSSQKLVYNVESFAYTKNTFFWMHSVPLIYLPVLGFSTKSKRASGFLPPEYAHSNELGNRLKIPYFLELGTDQDLTITMDSIQKKGIGLDLEYNYAFYEGMKGQFDYWILNESINSRTPSNESRMEESDDPLPIRYHYKYQHRQNTFFNGSLFLSLQENSDNEVNKDYFNQNIELDYYQKKSGHFIFPWNQGGLQISVETGKQFKYQSRYDKSTNSETYLNRIPSVVVTKSISNLFNTSSSISFYGDFTKFERKYGWEGNRNLLSMQLNSPMQFDFLNIITKVKRTFFDYRIHYNQNPHDIKNREENPPSFGWFQDHVNIEFNIELYRKTEINKYKAGKFSIQPRLIADWVSDVNQRKALDIAPEELTYKNSDYINYNTIFDSEDQEKNRKSITFRLDTSYQTKYQKTAEVRSLFQLNLIQIYNLNRKGNKESQESSFKGPVTAENKQETKLGNQALPMRIELKANPFSFFSGELKYRYDHEINQIIDRSYIIALKDAYGNSFQVTYENNTKEFETLDSTLHPISDRYVVESNLFITNYWKAGFTGTWDLTRNSIENTVEDTKRIDTNLIEFSSNISYQHDCYAVTLNYEHNIKTREVEEQKEEYIDRKITLAFELNELFSLPYAF